MNKDEIRQLTKNMTLKTEKVTVDPLGDLYVREMNAKVYTDISNKSVVNSEYDPEKFMIYAIIASTFDVNGTQIWENIDYNEVANLSAGIYTKITEAVMKINNINGATNKSKN